MHSAAAHLLEVIVVYRGTVLDVHHLGPDQAFTVGAEGAHLNHAHAALPEAEPWPLAVVDEAGRARLDLPKGVLGALFREGAVQALEQPGGVRLLPGYRARVELGDVALICSLVRAAAALEAPRRRQVDTGGRRAMTAAAMVHAMVLALAFSMPVDAGTLSMDRFEMPEHWVEQVLVAEQHKPEVHPLEIPLPPPTAPSAGSAPGPTDPIEEALSQALEDDPGGEGKAVAEAVGQAVRTNLEAELAGAIGGTELLTQSGLGEELVAAMNNLDGSDHGQPGALVAGRVPGGPMGPGGPGRSQRIGRYTTGGGDGDRRGRPRIKTPTRQAQVPPPVFLPPQIEGGLSRDDIARVIRRARKGIRHCYEKRLQQVSGLEGKAVMVFMIGSDGRVLSAVQHPESTMDDAEVGACLRRRLKRMQFPAVSGGGVVKVKYPFLFRSR